MKQEISTNHMSCIAIDDVKNKIVGAALVQDFLNKLDLINKYKDT
jgi:hypothetical protein